MQYKCINVSLFVQNALLKGGYSYANVDLDPLFVFLNVISLLFDRTFFENCCKLYVNDCS